MSQINEDLDPESLEVLQQARAVQRQMRNLGMSNVEPLERPQKPQPVHTKIDKEIETPPAAAPASQEVVSHENYIEIENLPSRGLFYRNQMKGQALKVEDLLLIQGIDELNVNDRFNEIFGRRINDVLPDEILSVDELYISLWLRATSFPGYNFPADGFVCENPKCDFELNDPEYEIPFQQITWDVNKLPEDIVEYYKERGCVPVVLPSNKTVDVYMGRRFHTNQVFKVLKENYYDLDREPSDEDVDILKIASVTDTGNPDLLGRANEIKKWDVIDFLELIKAVNKYNLTAEPVVNHICPKCKEVTSIKGYPFRPEIFLPLNSR